MNTSKTAGKISKSRLFAVSHIQILFWCLVAGLIGIVIATQPLATSFVIMAGVVFFIIAFQTPIATLIMLLVLAPMRTLIETEARVPFPLDIGQVLVLFLALCWLGYQTSQQRRQLLRLRYSTLFIPIIIFLLVISLSSFTALSISAWLSEWLKWVIITVLVIVVLNIKQWEWLIFGLVIAAAANAIVGIYIYFGGSGALHLLISEACRCFRAFGTFGQPNPFGGFMGLIFPIALTACLGYAVRLWQYYRLTHQLNFLTLAQAGFYAFGSCLIAAGLIVSWSRGAWLGFGIALFVMSVLIPRKFWQSLILFVMILALVSVLWTSGRLPATIVERIESATQEIFAFDDVRGVNITPENYAVIERLAHWQAALNMARSNWWLGVGFGNYDTAYETYRLINWDEPLGHAHNYYLNVLAETGIIGISAYLALWIGVFWITWQAQYHPDILARLIAVGLFGTWTYLAVHSLTDNLYVNNLFLHMGIMLGITALLYNQTRYGIKLKKR